MVAARLQTLALDVMEQGHVRTAAKKAAETRRLLVVNSAAVDWSDPSAPTAPWSAVVESQNLEFWQQIAKAHPTWINLAWYDSDHGHGCLIVEHNAAAERAVWADPSIAVTGAPANAALRLREHLSDEPPEV